MIKYHHGSIPKVFNTKRVKEKQQKVLQFYSRPLHERRQDRFEDEHYHSLSIRNDVQKKFNGHCAFCDRVFDNDKVEMVIHSFRPQQAAQDEKSNEHLDYYYWLIYEWENIYPLCQDCHSYKWSFFPVKRGTRAKIEMPLNEIYKYEKPKILDPCQTDPEDVLYYNDKGEIFGRTPEAKLTISRLRLNRAELKEGRVALKKKMDTLLKDFWNILARDHNPDIISYYQKYIYNYLRKEGSNSFKGFARWYFNKSIKESKYKNHQYLFKISSQYVSRKIYKPRNTRSSVKKSTTSRSSVKTSRVDSVDIKNITIKNFRNIGHINIDIPRQSESEQQSDYTPWTFLLGENGSGKSSVLQATVLALLKNDKRQDINIDYTRIVKRNQNEACEIIIDTKSRGKFQCKITNEGKVSGTRKDAGLPILAYGSTRLMTESGDEVDFKSRSTFFVDNLFDPFVTLTNAKDWLFHLQKDDFDRAAVVIKKVLGVEDRLDNQTLGQLVKSKKDKNIYFVKGNNDQARLDELSDGYKILFALSCDIMRRLKSYYAKEKADFKNMDAIIFIDEIGTHLHPRWKKRIVRSLRESFVKAQFYVTSHEPLCLRGTLENEVKVIKYDAENGEVRLVEDLPSPNNYRIDQILTSPFFGMSSTIDPEDDIDFIEYYDLLSLTPDNLKKKGKTERLKQLAEKVHKQNHFSNSLREEVVYHVVDKLIAEQKSSANHEKYIDEAEKLTREFWDLHEGEIVTWINNNNSKL